jgi:hypothetical protein
MPDFDVAKDGRRILALLPAEALWENRRSTHVAFLVNLFDELRRSVSAAGR